MKNTFLVIVSLLVTAFIGVQAQSAGNAAQQGAATSSNPRKANNSQMMGKGVPDTKKTNQQGQSGKKISKRPIPESTVSTGPDAAASPSRNKTPGTHTAHRENSMGRKGTQKTAKQAKTNP